VHFPFSSERNFYGLSRPENNEGIVYKAAAEVKTPDEASKYKLDTMVIPKGNYVTETVHNFKEDVPVIGRTFEKLLEQPNLDPQGYCVEWYLPNDKDVMCMIRLQD
jgi:predicted transcriptional regulator YdeE